MYRKNIDRFAKCLLMFILFFNTLFYGIEECFASSLKTNLPGVRDRIRRFPLQGENTNDKREIDFRFNPETGFSCKVGNLRRYPNRDDSTEKISSNDPFFSKIKKEANIILQNTASFGWDILVSVLLQPIMCVAFLKSIKSSGSNSTGKSLLGALGTISILIGIGVLEDIQEMILDEDDYNVDVGNMKYCGPFYFTDLASCTVITVILSLKSIDTKVRLFISLGISILAYIIKIAISETRFKIAKKAFDNLSLCGDNWNVYGNDSIYEDHKNDIKETLLEFNDIKDNFPIKGAFFGSYEYLLNECFENRNQKICKKLFNITTSNDIPASTLDGYANILRQQYREYKYGGVEFAYSNCHDPREERIAYLGKNAAGNSHQLYYFRGSEPANFACDRFLVKNTEEYRTAYNCCINASQKLICIVNNEESESTYKMCDKDSGSECKIKTKIDVGEKLKESDEKMDCTTMKETITSQLSNSSMSEEEKQYQINNIYDNICDENGEIKSTTTNQDEISDDNKGGNNIILNIRKSLYTDNKYCVETYNLCPYNFYIGGGTESYGAEFKPSYKTDVKVECNNEGVCYEDTKNEKITKKNEELYCEFSEDGTKTCKGRCYYEDTDKESGIEGVKKEFYYECYNRPSNFCQLNRHCVTITPFFERELPDTNPYIDEACLNMVGSSHNYDGYSTLYNRTGTSIFLSAPLVECITETAKNILLNTAGHTKCIDGKEEPVENNKCVYTGEKYIKGQKLDENVYPAPFFKIRKYILNIVKALLALAFVLYGYNYMVFGKGFHSPEEIIKFLLKVTIVSYFAISTNWISPVFSGVYTVFNRIAVLGMDLVNEDPDYTDHKYGGCHFIQSDKINNNYSEYGSRKYLAVFDTLDCKLARYFGIFIGNKTTPPILSFFIIGILSCGIMVILMLPLALLFMSLLYFIINTSFSFITSAFIITVLLFLSPIMIPLYLFERTKGNFIKWLKVIVSNIFSQLFLIMCMFLFFTLFDKYFVGDAVFFGKNEPMRNLYCGKICKINENEFYYVSTEKDEQSCKEVSRGEVINLSKKSLICIMKSSAKTGRTNFGILNFLIEDFTGFQTVGKMAISFFNCFIDIVFLLVIIFMFNQFIPYIGNLTNAIFESIGSDTLGNVLSFSLKDVLNKTAKTGTDIANKMKDYGGKMAYNTARNKIDQLLENRKGSKKEEKKEEEEGKEEEEEKKEGESNNNGSGKENKNDEQDSEF